MSITPSNPLTPDTEFDNAIPPITVTDLESLDKNNLHRDAAAAASPDKDRDDFSTRGSVGEAPVDALITTLALLTGHGHDLSSLEPGASEPADNRHFHTLLSDRQIHHAVWTLAWPSIITMLMQTVNSLMDVFFVGHLPNGAHALAATGIGGSIMFLLISLAMGVSVGTTALVARFEGAEDAVGGIQATGQSITLSLLCALVFGAIFYCGRTALVGVLLDSSHNPEAARLCTEFIGIALLAVVPLFMMNVLMGAFRGLGDTRTPMLITIATIATHIGLNSVLIYGRLGFPRMEVRGAATAFAASLFVGLVLYLFALKRSPLGSALQYEHLRLKPDWAWRIFRIGLPAAGQAVIRQLGMMSFTGMLARTVEGTASVAALQIGIRAESIAFMPGFGYSVAAATLVGQNLGARNPRRAEQSAWAATYQAIAVMALMAAAFFAMAHFLAGVFTSDASVRLLGADYLRVNAICEPFLALGMVLTGALQGAGDTMRPTYITLFTMWVLRLPFGYLMMFVLHLNTHGAWIAMSVTTITGGLMTVCLFRAGTWKRIKV